MRLYLQADSKNGVVYIPDWIKVNYNDGELVFDIQAEKEYGMVSLCLSDGAIHHQGPDYSNEPQIPPAPLHHYQ